jgi:hypothetical protein
MQGIEEKRTLKRLRDRWEDKKLYEMYGMSCSGSGGGSCECGNELRRPIKFRQFVPNLRSLSFSRRSLLHGVMYLCIYRPSHCMGCAKQETCFSVIKN